MWHPDMPDSYKNAIVTGDARELMKRIPGESIHLVFVDPPYNIGKAEWDKIDNYFEWCGKWIAECSRVLKPNGAFWVSHSKPLALAQLSGLIAGHGKGLVNWITWDKYHVSEHSQIHALPDSPQLRSFVPIAEYLIYHADEGEWTSQCDKESGFIFEPLREYLDSERKLAGYTDQEMRKHLGISLKGGGLLSHYWGRAQWILPTKDHYYKLRELFNSGGGNYFHREHEDLRREYEDLRREYEYLRYTFNNPGKMSSVWQIPPAKANFHATPKPIELMRRIIKATSNEGDIILDPMCGSGTTAFVSKLLNRNYIAFEIEPNTVELARERVCNTQSPLFVMEPEQLELA